MSSAVGPSTTHTRSRARVAALIGVVLLGAGLAPLSAHAAGGTNLDQFATLDAAWQNGNLNGNNARYPEGGVVPFRLAIEGLAPGKHTLHINYDFTAGGHKAYDFLASWNAWSKPNLCSAGGGGVSSLCSGGLPAPSSKAMPADPFATNGLSVNAAEVFAGVSRRLTIWGGTIQSISAPKHTGSTSGNSTADVTVTFISTGTAVLLAWGGHLAQSRFWDRAAGGSPDGAAQVSGAPWHMRTLGLDGGGNRNQDRSIQPSAIVGEIGPPLPPAATPAPPAAVPPTPRPSQPVHVPTGSTPRPTAPPTSIAPAGLPQSAGGGSAIYLAVLGLIAAAAIASFRPGRRLARPPRNAAGRTRPGPG